MSLTKVVRTEDRTLVGLIGIDLPLANLLEDVTHFTSPAHSYAFVMDADGTYSLSLSLFHFSTCFSLLQLVSSRAYLGAQF